MSDSGSCNIMKGAKARIISTTHRGAGQKIHTFPDKLHVVTMLENPLRWRSRYWNYWMFERECAAAGAILYTAEVAFGGRSLR